MFDVTVGETREFEQLPEGKWILARLISRGVIRYDGISYKESTDDILRTAFANLEKARQTGDPVTEQIANDGLKPFQFQFVFRPLIDKKFAAYRVRGNTGLWPTITKPDGTFAPNKLGALYLGAGGLQVKVGEKINIDTVVGNYVAIKVVNKKNQKNKKVYQHVEVVRPLTDDELAKAKVIEIEVKKIEDAVRTAQEKSQEETGEYSAPMTNVTQSPVLESGTKPTGEVPF